MNAAQIASMVMSALAILITLVTVAKEKRR